jgi:hypothetical protein
MEIVAARFKFPYCVEFVPYRCRNAQTHSLTAEGVVGLRSIKKHEAEEAFRLRYPHFDRRRLLKRARKVIYYVDPVREAHDLTVISYAGGLWSPRYQEYSETDNMTEFLEGLADGSELCTMENHGVPRDQGAIDSARSIVVDGHDEALASATGRIYRNFLICNDVPYVRTGVPIFVRHCYSETSWEIDIGDAPPDRLIEPFHSVRSSHSWDYEKELRSGPIWLPDQEEAAQTAAHPLQPRIPTIQLLTDPPSSELIVHVRIDAIMRETIRIVRGGPRWWSYKADQPFGRELNMACEQKGSDFEMSSRRVRALVTCFEEVGWQMSHPYFNVVRREFSNLLLEFQNGSLPDPRLSMVASSCGLTEAEEAALEGL